MNERCSIEIAGRSIALSDFRSALDELGSVYEQFSARGDSYKADGRNPHLCRAGCSHCCKSGAVFAVTLAEAVRWSMAIEALPASLRGRVRQQGAGLLERQQQVFAEDEGDRDTPGCRDETLFSARVSRLNQASPACPLLVEELCSVYDDRPLLCRAYGLPVDAYAVQSDSAIVFRSLCVLYEGMQLSDYVRAEDLKERLFELSRRMGGGRDWGRFTSPEAILSRVIWRD